MVSEIQQLQWQIFQILLLSHNTIIVTYVFFMSYRYKAKNLTLDDFWNQGKPLSIVLGLPDILK